MLPGCILASSKLHNLSQPDKNKIKLKIFSNSKKAQSSILTLFVMKMGIHKCMFYIYIHICIIQSNLKNHFIDFFDNEHNEDLVLESFNTSRKMNKNLGLETLRGKVGQRKYLVCGK